MKSHANIEAGVRAALAGGALRHDWRRSFNQYPLHQCVRRSGGHSYPANGRPSDFVDERHGVRCGHGNPMRRAAEKPYVTGLTQVGIRKRKFDRERRI